MNSMYAYLNRDKQMNEFLALPPSAKREALHKERARIILAAVMDIRDNHHLGLSEACKVFMERYNDYPELLQIEAELRTNKYTARSLYNKLWNMELELVTVLLDQL